MQTTDLLLDCFSRVKDGVRQVVDGLDEGRLCARPDGGSNSIAWLVWHLTRVQDDHIAEVAGTEQVWAAGGWAERFALPLPPEDTGYGHEAHQVALVKAAPEQLVGYHEAVFQATSNYLQAEGPEVDLERVVDRRWDPPVTLGTRLVSVIADDLQHVGQAGFLRGLLERRSPG